MIENLQNELYQLENKQAKVARLGVTLLWLIVNCKCKFCEKNPQVHLIIIRELSKNNPLPCNWRKGVILDRNTPKLFSKYLVHGIGAKLVSNWEQKMLYNQSQQIFFRKEVSILTGLKA